MVMSVLLNSHTDTLRYSEALQMISMIRIVKQALLCLVVRVDQDIIDVDSDTFS